MSPSREEVLEKRFHWINWREPITVKLIDGTTEGIACQFCIGTIGFPGSSSNPFPDEKAFREHMLEHHGIEV